MGRPSHILMVDDSRADANLFREALRENALPVEFTWIPDVAQGLSYLCGGHPHTTRRPDLIILDVNMPGLDGWDMLRQLKQDPVLKRIPVLVLSSSVSYRDIHLAYSLDANCYLIKPVDWDDYSGLVKSINNFWLGTATLASSEYLVPLAEVA